MNENEMSLFNNESGLVGVDYINEVSMSFCGKN